MNESYFLVHFSYLACIVSVLLLSATYTSAAVADFNGDGHPDYVLTRNTVHGVETAILYLHGPTLIGSAYGPTLSPTGWGLIGAADFNHDGHPDYVLESYMNINGSQAALWYLSGPTSIKKVFGPHIPYPYILAGTADFNGDGYPDYVLHNENTNQTAIWYLHNNVYVSNAFGPTLPSGRWYIVGVADFNHDGHPDYVLANGNGTGQTAIWYLSGPTYIGGVYGPSIPPSWYLVAVADFNGDGHPDYVLYNDTTNQTAIWYLNNNVYVRGAFGPTLPAGWSLF